MAIASLMSLRLALLFAGAPAPLDAKAHERWDRADGLASEGRHDEAVKEYALAWQDLHAPAILYSWAQSERLRGHCTEAAALYERFVTEGQTAPPSYDTELLRAQWSNMLANAERQRDACRDPASEPASEPTAGAGAPTEPTAKPEPTTAPASSSTDQLHTPSSASRPWWRDAVGWSLAGTGAATLAAGATLLGVAAWEDGRAEELGSHGRFRDAIDRAVIEQRVGFGLLGLGGALVVGGIVRFAVIARPPGRERAAPSSPRDRGTASRHAPSTRWLDAVSLSPTPRGLVLRGRF
jgi:hypothetical protein